MTNLDRKPRKSMTEEAMEGATKLLIGILVVAVVVFLIILLVQSTGENTEAKMNHYQEQR